jgi:hypothetical protein
LTRSVRAAEPIATENLKFWEQQIEQAINNDSTLPETDRIALVRSRMGQGLFKLVKQIEVHCRITIVDNPAHWVAKRCKP